MTDNVVGEQQLLPCPFCGAMPAVTHEDGPHENVECENVYCLVQPRALGITARRAHDTWNTRAVPAPSVAQLDKCVTCGHDSDERVNGICEAMTNFDGLPHQCGHYCVVAIEDEEWRKGAEPTTVGQNQVWTDGEGIYHSMKTKPFSELRAKMSPEAQAKSAAGTAELLAKIAIEDEARATAGKIIRTVYRLRSTTEYAGELLTLENAITTALSAQQAEIDRLTKLVNEYGGQRCTNVCPPFQTCDVAHWCLLAQNHEGEHLHPCALSAAYQKGLADGKRN